MSDRHERIVWITGASSGIGSQICLRMLARGDRVIATVRNPDSMSVLKNRYPHTLTVIGCDLTDPAQMKTLGENIRKKSDRIDIAIFNAGVCEYVDQGQMDVSLFRRVFEVNFFAVVECVRIAMQLMQRNTMQKPQLVAIASMATMLPFSRAEAYGSSKSAVDYFFRSLRSSVGSEFDVTVIHPGFVRTPMTDANDFPMPFLVDVDVAAGKILRAIDSRCASYSFPRALQWVLRISALMERLFPGRVASRLRGSRA